ncbi:MAG: hypothetical protein RLY11_1079 [Bacteroidota bacterium]
MHNAKTILFALLIGFTIGCNNQKNPSVDDIKIALETKRFEKDFFQLDTNRIDVSLKSIQTKYPDFFYEFTDKILGLGGIDSTQKIIAIKKFRNDYQSIYDSTKKMDESIEKAVKDIKKSFQYIRYYIPSYELPKSFTTFIGPIDAFAYGETGGSGDIITSSALCSGLQLHLGSESTIYTSEIGQQLYPTYMSRKFTPAYIPVNCIKNIVDDLYPAPSSRNSLLEIVVDHGKRMYLLDLFMPFEKDEIKLGYTAAQLKGAIENEGFIWNYFTENKLLFETDQLKFRSFISDGPVTSEFGLGSPGFISLFVGRQLVHAYMKEHPTTKLKELISLDPKTILSGSKYRPR